MWWMAFAKAGAEATMQGVQSYFAADAAKAQAKAKARVGAANASMLRSQKVTQDIANRQALDALAQQRNAVTDAYRAQQGANIAGAGAANVDISSGSAAQILEGNANRYAQDMARSRYAEAIQQWQGESALSMLEAQAKGYDITSSAQRSIANMIDPLGNAIGSSLMSFGMSLLQSDWGKNKVNEMFASPGKTGGDEYWDSALGAWGKTDMTWRH
jgi:hypothetical protein